MSSSGTTSGSRRFERARDRRARLVDERREAVDVLLAEASAASRVRTPSRLCASSSARSGITSPALTGASPSGAAMSPANATSIARAPR